MALQESVKKEVKFEGAKRELDPSGNDIAPIYNLKIFNIFPFRLFSSSLLNYHRNCRGGGRAIYRTGLQNGGQTKQKNGKTSSTSHPKDDERQIGY